MATRYLWDSQAAQEVLAQQLDQHYQQHAAHYVQLAQTVWDSLCQINQPTLLKHGDLYDSLLPLIQRDSITQAGMTHRNLPEPLGYGSAKWYQWFTHFVTERYMERPGVQE